MSAGGAVGSVTVGSVAGTAVTAGGASGTGMFANGAGQIKSFAVKSKAAGAFADTRLSAPSIGSAKLGRVSVVNGGNVFGVTARVMKTVSAVTPAVPKFSRKTVAGAGGAYNEGDFEVRLLA